MTDFDTSYSYDTNSYDTGYGYDTSDDATAWTDLSNDIAQVSWNEWGNSIEYSQMADAAWLSGQMELYWTYDEMADTATSNSWALWDASWDAWYGPVNAEGYTAYDASMGYTSTDTSFIEPASAADNTSLISNDDTSATL